LYFHLFRRKAADNLRSKLLSSRTTRWLPTAMENKWYVDEVYIALIRTPLWILGKIFTLFDRYIIDGAIVNGIASIPRAVAKWFSPLHNGAVQSYAVSMIGGAILIAILMLAFLLLKDPGFLQLTQGSEQVLMTVGGGQ